MTSTTLQTPRTATLLGRLRATRHLWLYVLLVVLAPVAVLKQWRVVTAESAAPDIGLDVQRTPRMPARVATHDETRWDGVKTGDAVLTVNGQTVVPLEFFHLRTHLPHGPVTIVFERDGARFERSIDTRPTSRALQAAYVTRLLQGALLLLIALAAFLLRPGVTVSWRFMGFLYALSLLTMMTYGFFDNGILLYLSIYTLLGLVPAIGWTLLVVFPRELPVPRWATWVIVGPSLLLPLAHVARVLFWPDAPAGGLEIGTRAWAGVCSTVQVGGQVWGWRHAKRGGDTRTAEQYRLLAVASVLGLFLPILVNVVSRALKLDGSAATEISSALVLVFALMTAYVLVRHNPLAIDRYSASVVGYVITLGAIAILLAAALLALPVVLNRVHLAESIEAVVVVTAGLSVSVGPLYRWLRRRVDRFFSAEHADALQTAAALKSVTDAVQQRPAAEAQSVVLDAARTLGGEQVSLWLVDASGRAIHRAEHFGGEAWVEAIPRSGPVLEALMRSGGISGLAPAPFSPAAQEVLWSRGLVMTAPVASHGVALGFLALGRRPSGFAFRTEDQSFLEALATQLGVSLDHGDRVKTVGRYRIERRLATGGMAEIFVAWQLGPGGFERKVALKRLLPELAEDERNSAALLDEARVMARLSHRNIAQTFEVGLEAGQHFIAMEFVDGPPLRALVSAAKNLKRTVPLPVVKAIAQQLLGALEHAHTVVDGQGQRLGVVHRDVTPANVLVSREGEVKLVDFGLVMANTRLFRTEAGRARGTIPYMAREQATGQPLDARADVYGSAATLYELLTGARARPEGPMGAPPAPLSSLRPELSPALDAVFARAFADEPAERYSSAAEFARALDAVLSAPAATPAEVAKWVASLLPSMAELRPRTEAKTQTLSTPATPNDVPLTNPNG